jgi:hypothetical protein
MGTADLRQPGLTLDERQILCYNVRYERDDQLELGRAP